MANPFKFIKAFTTKKTGTHIEDYITSTDSDDGLKRGLDFNPVAAKAYLMEVSKGNVTGQQIINKFGGNDAVGTNFVPVCSGSVYQTPNTLTALELVSTSNDDTATGSGARVVRLSGLNNINGVWTEDIQDVTLTGTTPVSVPNSLYRNYKMRVLESGTYATAVAPTHNSTITLSQVATTTAWSVINTEGGFGLSSSEIGVFSIPKGQTGYLISLHLDVEASKSVDVIGFVREGTDIVTAPYSPMTAFFIKRSIDGEHAAGDGHALQKIVGPADIGFMARVSQGTAKVEVEFDLLCIAD